MSSLRPIPLEPLRRAAASERDAPTFARFIAVGTLNTVVFYGLFELGLGALGSDALAATLAWALSWFVGSLFAHATHRRWTFHSDVRWRRSATATLAIYALAMVGSTLTYELLVAVASVDPRLAWAVNTAVWGVLDFLGLRHVAFPRRSGSRGPAG